MKKELKQINAEENGNIFLKKVLTIEEVVIYTGFKKSYLFKLTSGKIIPHSKPTNGALFFDREKIEAWLSRNQVKTIYEVEQDADNFKLK